MDKSRETKDSNLHVVGVWLRAVPVRFAGMFII